MKGRLILLCTAQFVCVLDANAVLVSLPLIGRELRLHDVQWVVTAYALTYAGFLIPAGRIADRYGRRRIFALGLALFTGASLACGIAPTAVALIAARALQGLGAALVGPSALAMLEGERRAVAVWTAVAAVGGASGLLVGGALAGAFGWRSVFLINLPVGIAALAFTPTLPESRAPRARLAVNRRVATAALVGAVLTATTSSGAVHASLQLQETLTPEQAALRLLPLSVAVVVGSMTRIGIAGGLVLVAAGSLAGAFGVIPAWAVLAGLGLGAASVAATTLGTQGTEDRGSAAGILSTAAQVGTALGVATLGSFAAVVALSSGAAALALWPSRFVRGRGSARP